MFPERGLSRENSDTIGFVITSLLCSAIDLEELKEWCYGVVNSLETGSVPEYIYELIDFNGTISGIYKLLGFVPSWKHTENDTVALYGIAMLRGKTRYEWPVDAKTALDAITNRPDIATRFRETFPFISF